MVNFARARSISLSLLLKPLNSPAGRQHVGSKINHRDARAAQDVAPCDRRNKLRVRSAKGHVVAFTATFAYIRETINIVQHNLRRAVHAPRDDVSSRASNARELICERARVCTTRCVRTVRTSKRSSFARSFQIPCEELPDVASELKKDSLGILSGFQPKQQMYILRMFGQ